MAKLHNLTSKTTGIRGIHSNFSRILKAIGDTSNMYYYEGMLNKAVYSLKVSTEFLELPEIQLADKAKFLQTCGKIMVNTYFYTGSGDDLINATLNSLQEMANELHDKFLMANSIFLKGQNQYYHNLVTGKPEIQVAQKTLMNGANLLEEAGDMFNLPESLIFVGLTFEMEGNRGRARDYYIRAMNLAEQHKNKFALSLAFRHLTDHVDGEERLQFALKSLRLREEMKFKLTLPLSNLLVSEIYADRSEFRKATDYCRKAERLANKMNLQNALVFVFLTYSRLEELTGKKDNSLEYARKGMDLAESLKIAFSVSAAAQRVKAATERD